MIKCEDSTLTACNSELNITATRRLLNQAVKMLSLGNAVCLQKRKTSLKPFLERRYHHLTLPANPVSRDLLGPDLEQKITDCNKILDAGKKIAKPRYINKRNENHKNTMKYPKREYAKSDGNVQFRNKRFNREGRWNRPRSFGSNSRRGRGNVMRN